MQVFCFTGDKAHEEMRSACFDYLRLGGMYSAGPISLLSGLNPRPSVLVTHFFMVAIFGFGRWAQCFEKGPEKQNNGIVQTCAAFPLLRHKNADKFYIFG